MAEAWERELDWENDLERPDGYPLAAMLLGGAFLLVVAIAVLGFSGFDVTAHALPAIAVAIVLAAATWGVAWWLTLRRTAIGWRIGNGVVFAGVAIGAVVIAIGMAAVSVGVDAGMMRMIRINAAGEPELPPGARPGPITRAGMDFLRDMFGEARRRQAAMVALGMDRLADAAADTADPALLRDCGRFARSRGEVDASDHRIAATAQRFRDRITQAVAQPKLRDALVKDFDHGFDTSASDRVEQTRLQHEQFDQAGLLCTFLATHRWQPAGTRFMFSDQASLSGFDRVIGPWNSLVIEQQQLTARSTARMRATGLVSDETRIN